jgi:hypothetical protein
MPDKLSVQVANEHQNRFSCINQNDAKMMMNWTYSMNVGNKFTYDILVATLCGKRMLGRYRRNSGRG